MDDDAMDEVRVPARAGVAGALLILATTHANPDVRRYAEAAAKVVARDGLERGRGWLQGLWYVGGVRPVVEGGNATTYHDVVWALQAPLGLDIVTQGA